MSPYEITSSVISVFALMAAVAAAYFTYKNILEIRNQFFEQNRGNLLFLIVDRGSGLYSTVVKNFGNSPAKLISLTIDPELDWSKTKGNIPQKFVISKCKNVFIAPGQLIESFFDFSGYPDEKFHIDITYETLNKRMTESYDIDLAYNHRLVDAKITIKDTTGGLRQINNSVRELSDRFL